MVLVMVEEGDLNRMDVPVDIVKSY